MSGLSALFALFLLCCCLGGAYLLALELGIRRGGWARACATLALAYGLLIAAFELLLGLGVFTLGAALLLWGLFTGLLLARGWARARVALRWDVRRLQAMGRAMRREQMLGPLALGALLVGARLLRGLAAPPLAWDSLTYHLVKAGRWVQSGRDEILLAPDAWSYYQYFLPYGDALSAWAMLPAHGDGFLAPAGGLIWLSALVGAYGMARGLGARWRMAVPAALAAVFVPIVMAALTASYVDNTILALFLLAMALLLASLRPGRQGERVAAMAALGVLAGIKPGGLPVFCLGGALVCWGTFQAWRSRQAPRFHAGLVVLALLLGVLPYLRAWVLHGSPFFPWPLTLAGIRISEGSPALAGLESGELLNVTPLDVPELAMALLFSRFLAGTDHLGLGHALLLAPVGLLAAVRTRRRWGARSCLVLACGASTLLGSMSRQLWTAWASTSSRFVLCMLATCLLLAALLEEEWVRLLLWGCFLLELLLGLPCGWAWVDARGVLLVLPAVLVTLGGAAALVAWGLRRHRLLPGLLAAVMLLGGGWEAIAAVRAALRYEIYASAVKGQSYELHALVTPESRGLPEWKALDGEAPLRLAVTAGWDISGHNWYWYPLMGSRLQNTLTYVPISADGSVRDYALKDTFAQADFPAWLRRVREARVDYVVTLAPAPIEARWMAEHPELFQPAFGDAKRDNVAWRVLPAADGRDAR
ncbi:hypothetical protein CYFUS_009321 [Cystobacter fuscus]|uniref:Glycosyltransferase RgtA/B/C/D-like domain-containing protein n=1 Tax=Cystobacter fuscus TaxID=43 RepID=A0A250JKB7_9BACT|nr:hypothetical protein [Cystobacter fuscus]ATB43841.1 hypothetical protein CYFUS_009321 [Cystobacter fuscus]